MNEYVHKQKTPGTRRFKPVCWGARSGTSSLGKSGEGQPRSPPSLSLRLGLGTPPAPAVALPKLCSDPGDRAHVHVGLSFLLRPGLSPHSRTWLPAEPTAVGLLLPRLSASGDFLRVPGDFHIASALPSYHEAQSQAPALTKSSIPLPKSYPNLVHP